MVLTFRKRQIKFNLRFQNKIGSHKNAFEVASKYAKTKELRLKCEKKKKRNNNIRGEPTCADLKAVIEY